jgi:fumarate hydratase subunit alpha
MRKIPAKDIETAVKSIIYQANFVLPQKVQNALRQMQEEEKSDAARLALEHITANMTLAPQEELPLCQDTGNAVFWIEIGHQVELEEPLEETLNRATAAAYDEYNLRKSVVAEPLFERKNTKTNTPVFSHIHFVAGEQLKISFLPKGAGAENKSKLMMLRPADGIPGIKKFVRETAQSAGGSACPPWIIGIGIGGTFDTVAALAKKAILRELETAPADERIQILEHEILTELEQLKIGTMAFGGEKTILGVHIEVAPCHIASLPVAVNLQCHSARTASITL